MERSRKVLKRVAAFLLAIIVTMSAMPLGDVQAASKKVALSKKKVSVYVGKRTKVTLKNVKSRVKWQIVSGKKVVSIKRSGKYRRTVSIKGKKNGTAKVRAIYKNKKYTIKVRVSKLVPVPTVSVGDKVIIMAYR